jgi:hypothetical protein
MKAKGKENQFLIKIFQQIYLDFLKAIAENNFAQMEKCVEKRFLETVKTARKKIEEQGMEVRK